MTTRLSQQVSSNQTNMVNQSTRRRTFIEITGVIDTSLMTAENPFEEPLEVEQFVAWKTDVLCEDIDI